MTHKYDQSSGVWTFPDGKTATGYSGNGRGKNNPSMQAVVAVGPIPRGKWQIQPPYNSANVGPYALILDPLPGTDTKGRSAFRIHGDSIKNPGTASHGCIILPRVIRERIWASGDRVLEVIE